MKYLFIPALTLSALYCGYSIADTLILHNGDKLTVAIDSIKHNTVYVKSSILGKIDIPMSGIQSIQFHGSYWIKLKGQNKFQFIVFDDKAGSFYKVYSGKSKSLCKIDELRVSSPSKVKNSIQVRKRASPGVQGAVKKAVITGDDLSKVPEDEWLYVNQLSSYLDLENMGKQDGGDLTASISGEHQLRNTHNRNIINWEVKNDKSGSNTNEKYMLNYNYNYFYTKKSFLTVNTLLSHDDDHMPYKLMTTAMGLGYQLYDTDELSFSVEGGAGYSLANYKDQSNSATPSFYGKFSYNQKITDTISFYDDTNVNGLIKDNSVIFDGKAGLKFMIRKNLWFEFAHSYTWTNTPDVGYNRYNGNVKAGIGVNW